MSKSPDWNRTFAPAYTPKEMIELGVFEGTYVRAIGNLPKSWTKSKKVLAHGEDGDVSLNKFGVGSRLPLRTWKEKGWIRTDAGGWFEWYCNYYRGRRLGEEDEWQIKRWRSFVARHQGQVTKAGKLKDESTRRKQRQGLLQWAWDSKFAFTTRTLNRNLKALSTRRGINIR